MSALLFEPLEFGVHLPPETIAYGKAWTRRFCNTLCGKLPCELLDQIYGDLVTDHHVPVDGYNRRGYRPFVHTKLEPTRFTYDAEWLGLQVTREIAQYCYRTLDFQFTFQCEWHSAERRWSRWFEEADLHDSNRYDLVRKRIDHG